ncbi:MAG: hypothetical protein HY234_10830 [Acidobacteria bacterium]|nr:hypothetical protein [Acidobacteriota bacterium]
MMKRLTCSALVLLLASFAACSVVQEKEKERADITAALQKYLGERSGLNLSAMDWNIKELNVDRDNASVQVTFTAKQGGASMVMEYEMKRNGGVWTVLKSGPRGSIGMPAHPGAGTEAAPTMPPAGTGTGTGALPSGHPPLTPEPKAPAKTPPPPKKSS